MAMSLTHKQALLLDFIAFYQRENGGVSPSFEQMAEAVDLKSKSGVARLMDALEERGRIVRPPYRRARAIEIVQSTDLAGIPTVALIAELTRRSAQNEGLRAA